MTNKDDINQYIQIIKTIEFDIDKLTGELEKRKKCLIKLKELLNDLLSN